MIPEKTPPIEQWIKEVEEYETLQRIYAERRAKMNLLSKLIVWLTLVGFGLIVLLIILLILYAVILTGGLVIGAL